MFTQIPGKQVSPLPLTELDQTGATAGQVPQWNGTAWAPVTLSSAGDPAIATQDLGTVTTATINFALGRLAKMKLGASIAPTIVDGAISQAYRVFLIVEQGDPIPAPSAPSLSVQGTSGSTTYGYRISAINASGETICSSESTIGTGNATLSGSNFVRITWASVPGATGYKVYGRTAGSPLLIATVMAGTQYDDTGAVTPSGNVPVVNTAYDARSLTWPSNVLYPSGVAPILSTQPNAKDIVELLWDGTKYNIVNMVFNLK